MLGIWRNRWALFGGFVGLASGILLTVCATLETSRAVLPDQIHDTLKLVADWQLDHMATSPIATDPAAYSSTTGWLQAVILYRTGALGRALRGPALFRSRSQDWRAERVAVGSASLSWR